MAPTSRRGKKNFTTNNTNNASSSADQLTKDTDEKLSIAMKKILQSKRNILMLHHQWRAQLFNLSFMVLFLSLFQLKKSFTKSSSIVGGEGGETLKEILYKCLPEVTGLLNVFFIMWYIHWEKQVMIRDRDSKQRTTTGATDSLHKSRPSPFSHISYSTSLILTCASVRFHQSFSSTDTDTDTDTEEGSDKRDFPISPVFLIIITFACMFMAYGRNKLDDNLDMILDLQTSIQDARGKVAATNDNNNSKESGGKNKKKN